jgi:GNAT superfamily N-acetyltransferase
MCGFAGSSVWRIIRAVENAADRIEPCDDDVVRALLKDRVDEFNVSTMGDLDFRRGTFAVRDEDGTVIAGIDGWCWGGTCWIVALWVAEEHRGQGLGSALLQRAEDEALAHGCHQIALESHSFQTPRFYVRHGYEEVGVLEGYPLGGAMHFLRKPLGRA